MSISHSGSTGRCLHQQGSGTVAENLWTVPHHVMPENALVYLQETNAVGGALTGGFKTRSSHYSVNATLESELVHQSLELKRPTPGNWAATS